LGGCLLTWNLPLTGGNADELVNRWVTIHDQRLLEAVIQDGE